MMKTLWTVTSTVGTATLLAILAMGIWAWSTGRMDGDRLDQIRALVMASPDASVSPSSQPQEPSVSAPTVPDGYGAADRIAMQQRGQDRLTWATQRLSQEKAMLAAQLAIAAESLKEREADFNRQKQAWLDSIEAEEARRQDTQFAKAIGQLELLPGDQAKEIIEALIEQEGLNEGVAYLDAMTPRGRARVLKEFRTPEEVALAARLLERMRIRGSTAEIMERQPHADDFSDGVHSSASGWDSR